MGAALRVIGLLAGLLAIAGCASTAEPKWAPDAEVARAAYHSDQPPSLTLVTVINNTTGGGGHSALIVNADERIIFDPAGTWYHPQLPERNDVHYGFAPEVEAFYIDYHTRVTWHTVLQKVEVSPQVAALAKRGAENYGAVPKMMCAVSVGTILQELPGFEGAPRGLSPKALMRYFAKKPGVETHVYRDYDSDDNSGVIQAPPVLHLARAG